MVLGRGVSCKLETECPYPKGGTCREACSTVPLFKLIRMIQFVVLLVLLVYTRYLTVTYVIGGYYVIYLTGLFFTYLFLCFLDGASQFCAAKQIPETPMFLANTIGMILFASTTCWECYLYYFAGRVRERMFMALGTFVLTIIYITDVIVLFMYGY